MPTWPATLPQEPALNSIQGGGPRGAFKRTSMEKGRPKTRPLTTAAPRPFSVTFPQMTGAQVDTFMDFFYTTLAGGAFSFTMDDPLTGSPATWQFASPENPFQVTPTTRTEFQISMTLEKLA